MKKLSVNKAFLFFLLCLFILMLFLNFKTYYAMDDYLYSLNPNHSHMSSFSDVFSSLSVFRTTINGRWFSHFFAKLFLLLPKWIFNIVNSIMTLACFVLLRRYIKPGTEERERESRSSHVILAYMLLFLFLPDFGQTFLWLTGSCNYSWAGVFILLYLLPYYLRYREGKELKPSLAALHFLLAFLAGAYSEHASFACIIIAFCFFAAIIRRERRVPIALFLSGTSACSGYLFLMTAPAAWNRQKGDAASLLSRLFVLLSGLPLPVLIVAALVILLALLIIIRCPKLRSFLIPGAILCAYICGLLLFFPEQASLMNIVSDRTINLLTVYSLMLFALALALDRCRDKAALFSAAVFALGAIAGVAIFVFAAYFPARAQCVTCMFAIISISLSLSALDLPRRRVPEKLALSAMGLVCAAVLLFAVKDILRSYRLSMEREEYIKYSANVLGQRDIAVNRIEPTTKYSALWKSDSGDFNLDICHYYGLTDFRFTD